MISLVIQLLPVPRFAIITIRALGDGGSTLREFVGAGGEPGHFQLEYAVYGREGEPCPACGRAVRACRHGGRASFFCASCQR